jgi:hypothetical protein
VVISTRLAVVSSSVLGVLGCGLVWIGSLFVGIGWVPSLRGPLIEVGDGVIACTFTGWPSEAVLPAFLQASPPGAVRINFENSTTTFKPGFLMQQTTGEQVFWLPLTNLVDWPSRAGVIVPVWILILALLLPAWVAGRGLSRMIHRHVHGLCAKCGYDLRASLLRCPECGAPIPVRAESRKDRAQ